MGPSEQMAAMATASVYLGERAAAPVAATARGKTNRAAMLRAYSFA